MTWLGETPFVHIGDVFAEGCDALLLQAAVFREKIAVSLRVAGRAFFVVAENVVGEKNCVSQPFPEPRDMRINFVCEHSQRARLCGTTSSSAA